MNVLLGKIPPLPRRPRSRSPLSPSLSARVPPPPPPVRPPSPSEGGDKTVSPPPVATVGGVSQLPLGGKEGWIRPTEAASLVERERDSVFRPISRGICGEGNGRKGAEKALSSLGHRLRVSSDVLAQRGEGWLNHQSPHLPLLRRSVGLSVRPSVGTARTIPQRAFLISTLAEKEGKKERGKGKERASEIRGGRRQYVSVLLFCHGFFMARNRNSSVLWRPSRYLPDATA